MHPPKGCVCAIWKKSPIGLRDLLQKCGQTASRVAGRPRQRQYPPPQLLRAGNKNRSSLVQAAPKVQRVMPDSTRKQQAIFTHLGPKVLGFSVQLQEKVKTYRKRSGDSCQKYYVDDGISRVMPGKADTIAIIFTIIITRCDCFWHKNNKSIPIT